MPCYPEGYHHFNCEETMLLKQPDVLMLMYMLDEEFSDADNGSTSTSTRRAPCTSPR